MPHLAKVHISYLQDNDLAMFYNALLASGRERISHYSGSRPTVEEYVRNVRKKENEPFWLLFYDKKMAGYVSLRHLEGRSGYLDYALLPLPSFARTGQGERLPAALILGRWLLASLLYETHIDGNPIMDTIIGKTPIWNKTAVKFIPRLGGQIVGVIPDCCYCYDSGQMSAGVMSFFNRQTVPFEWLKYQGE